MRLDELARAITPKAIANVVYQFALAVASQGRVAAAQVQSSGTLLVADGVLSSSRTGAGTYRVNLQTALTPSGPTFADAIVHVTANPGVPIACAWEAIDEDTIQVLCSDSVGPADAGFSISVWRV